MQCTVKDGRCAVHGAAWKTLRAFSQPEPSCGTARVLEDVGAERQRQYARYGLNDKNPDGTGPEVQWLAPLSMARAVDVEQWFRREYERTEDTTGPDSLSWLQLVREELAEAAIETDPKRLEEELIQVAALCVSWIEKIRER
jgi:hypothetical protein